MLTALRERAEARNLMAPWTTGKNFRSIRTGF